MTTTPRLAITQLEENQALPEAVVNEAVRVVEQGAGWFIVKDKDLATPPGSPADGDAYIVAASPTAAWSGKAKSIAMYISTGWKFVTPIEGTRAEVQDEDIVYRYSGSAWAAATALGGGLIGVQVITTTGSGTYTPTTGTTSIVIEMIGAGGGGAGVASAGAGNVAMGYSGGGGGYLRKRLSANFSGASYSVGAAGSGGAAGANNGSAGGNTTFTDTAGSPTTYTAAGGSGGNSRTTAVPPFATAGVSGGAGTNGDLNVSGAASEAGFAISTAIALSGRGGSSSLRAGAVPAVSSAVAQSVAGNSPGNYGGGGTGGISTTTGAAAAGGNGAQGVLIIYEYN